MIGTHIKTAVRANMLFTVLFGLLYPSVITGIAQWLFPRQANGSLIMKNGKPIGSEWIGQQFDDPRYFWGRLSATGPMPYNSASSSGSNLGPLNPALMTAARARVEALYAADPNNTALVPVDLVTASGSGLDPHISPAAAYYQVPRIARLRHKAEEDIRFLIEHYTTPRWLGCIGEPVVHVLKLNVALDNQDQ